MNGKKSLNTQFVIICLISFCFFLSNQMVVNTVTKYAKELNASTQLIGLIGGAYGFFALVMRPVSGQLVDSKSHRILLFSGVSLLLVSNLLLIMARHAILLFFSRMVNGLAFGIVSTLCMTTACNALPPEKLASGVGIYTMMQTIAQVIGPSIAIKLMETTNFKFLYIVTTFIMGVTLILCFCFKTNFVPKSGCPLTFHLKNMFAGKAVVPGTLLMFNVMQIATVSSFLLIYADEIGVGGLSFFFTIQALAIIVTRPIISRFLKSEYYKTFTLIGELFVIAGLVNLFTASTTTLFMVSAMAFGLGKSFYQPSLMSMCIESVSKEQRGRASNTAYAFNDIGQFAGSYISSLLVATLGCRFAFLGMGILIAMGTVFFCIAYHQSRKG